MQSLNVAGQDPMYLGLCKLTCLCDLTSVEYIDSWIPPTQRQIASETFNRSFPLCCTHLPDVSTSVFKKPVDLRTILMFWYYKNVMKSHWHMGFGITCITGFLDHGHPCLVLEWTVFYSHWGENCMFCVNLSIYIKRELKHI